jgi:Fe2+ or Zn2+ uptake regulation protein
MVRISVFRGRDARLNKAIFWVLARQGPLTIYDVWRRLRTQRDFAYIPYNTVNRRVRALAEYRFVEKIGQRRTKTGFIIVLYQLTNRAYLALLLDRCNLDEFIVNAPEDSILSALGAFTSII